MNHVVGSVGSNAAKMNPTLAVAREPARCFEVAEMTSMCLEPPSAWPSRWLEPPMNCESCDRKKAL